MFSNFFLVQSALKLSKSKSNTPWELIDSVAPYLSPNAKQKAHQTMHFANFFTELNSGNKGSAFEKTLHKTKLLTSVTNSQNGQTKALEKNLKLAITIDDTLNKKSTSKSYYGFKTQGKLCCKRRGLFINI